MPEPSLDSWTIIFLLASAQGLFVSFILGIKRKKQPILLIACVVFLFSISLLEYVAFWTGYRFVLPHIMNISGSFPFIYGPLFYLYIRTYTKNRDLVAKDAFHLVPFFTYLIYLVPYYVLNANTKVQMLLDRQFLLFESEPFISIAMWIGTYIPLVMITHLGTYTWLGFTLISGLDFEMLTKQLSRWLNVLRFSFLGFVMGFLSYYVMIYLFSYVLIIDYLISFAMAGFIYSIAYYSYSVPEVFEGNIDSQSIKPKYSNSGLSKIEAKQIKSDLEHLMDSEKMYLRNDLKLNDLASALSVSKHHISQVINNEFGTTFSVFVNEYRINNAKKLLVDDSNKLNMYGIASESGFKNKTTFSLAFKRHTGLTPSSFRQKVTEE